MIYNYEEYWSSVAMVCPTVASIIIATFYEYKLNTWFAVFSCGLHCPFSIILHYYTSTIDTDTSETFRIRGILYKLDVGFIHVYTFLTSCCWDLSVDYIFLTYTIIAILNIIKTDTVKILMTKKYNDWLMDGLCGLATYYNIIKVWEFNTILGISIIIFTAYASLTFIGIFGYYYRSFRFHILITIPQSLIMYSIANLK